MKRQPRYPVTISGEALRAIFAKPPRPSDTRPFLTRLLASISPVLRGNCRKGLTFLGVKGGTDF